MTLSAAKRFFESEAFADWRKLREHDQKVWKAVMSRQEAMIKGLDNVSKMLSGRKGL